MHMFIKILYPNRMFSFAFFLCFFVTNNAYSKSVSETSILINNNEFTYKFAPRLSQILLDARNSLDYSPYALGSALINRDSTLNQELKKKKQSLLKKLTASSNIETENLHSILNELIFSYRELVSLDLEKIQINKKNDPKITGSYKLSLPKRPDFLFLIDPLNSNRVIKIKMRPGYSLVNYVDEYAQSSNGNKIRIVQADKTIINPKINNWNNNTYYLSPGSFIYIGLNQYIDNSNELNQAFLALLQQHTAF